MSAPAARDQQAALVEAFARGAIAGVGPVRARFDTHLSHVFLTADRAYKLKRAVTLPFVDFSTLERRRVACEAELAVNRRMAEKLYLQVAPVARSNGGFVLGGSGEAVDWVVVMRCFEPEDRFDELAARGKLSVEHVEAAAIALADMHAQTPPNLLAGHAADYRVIIAGLEQTEAEAAAKLGLSPASPRIFEYLERALVRHGALIERRRAAGRVRRGHGDLHLKNLCLFEAEPMAFDALEFDDRLATGDVLYDLAFLLMDLRRLGLSAHANAALNVYCNAAGEDEAGLALLGFFMALRSAVRMAVAVEAGELGQAQTYRSYGLQLLAPFEPAQIAIGGLSGSGKSTVARAVAPLLPGAAGARLLRSDVVRKRGGASDDDVYAPSRIAATYADLFARTRAAVAAGASVIVDATFQDGRQRDAVVAALGAPSRFYWLDAPLAVRLERVAKRSGDASDADVRVAAAQQPNGRLGPPWRRLDAARAPSAIAADILDDDGAGD